MWGTLPDERTGPSFTEVIVVHVIYREDFYFVDRFQGSAHENVADESACLTAGNFRNEGKFFIHRPHEVLKMVPLYT
jgi:hypothetical protein